LDVSNATMMSGMSDNTWIIHRFIDVVCATD